MLERRPARLRQRHIGIAPDPAINAPPARVGNHAAPYPGLRGPLHSQAQAVLIVVLSRIGYRLDEC